MPPDTAVNTGEYMDDRQIQLSGLFQVKKGKQCSAPGATGATTEVLFRKDSRKANEGHLAGKGQVRFQRTRHYTNA